MKTIPFRTNETKLADNELLLLDVMFNLAVVPPMLRQCNFQHQFKLPPHSIDDASLKLTLSRFTDDGIIQAIDDWFFRGHQYISLTQHGAELWSSERCPVWEQHCSTRQTGSIPEKSFMSIQAVTPEIRDDFLRIRFQDPIRIKRTTICGDGMLWWKSFDRLHVGLACFDEHHGIPPEQLGQWAESQREHMMMIEQERTWWQSARELQKFTPNSNIA